MFITLALAGGAIPPIAPTITYGSLFNNGTSINATITNYNSEYTYTVVLSNGSFTRSASTINITGLISGQSFNLLVIATTAKGLSAPSSAVTDRLAYTYRTETRTGTRFVDTTSCYTPSPGPSCPFGGSLNASQTQCCIPSGYNEEYTYTVTVKNSPPSGYLDSGYDWYRVANVTVERTPYTYYSYTEYYTYPCSSTCCVDLPYSVRVCDTCSYQRCWTICYGNCTTYGPGVACGGAPGCYCPGCSPGDPCCYGPVCDYPTYECNCRNEQRCCSQYCSSCTITCTGSRPATARNPTPSGYLDSGVDWYRFV